MGRQPKRRRPHPTSEYGYAPLEGGSPSIAPRPSEAVTNIPSTRGRPPQPYITWDEWRQAALARIEARKADEDPEPTEPIITVDSLPQLSDELRAQLVALDAVAPRPRPNRAVCPHCGAPTVEGRSFHEGAIAQFTCGTEEDAAFGTLQYGDRCSGNPAVIRNSEPEAPAPDGVDYVPRLNLPKPTVKVLMEYQPMGDTFEITFLESLVQGSMGFVGGELRYHLPLKLDKIQRLQHEMGVFGAGIIMGIAPLPGITYMSIPQNQFTLNVHKSKLHDWAILVPAIEQVITGVWLQVFKETPIFAPRTDPFVATSTPEPPGETLRRLEP